MISSNAAQTTFMAGMLFSTLLLNNKDITLPSIIQLTKSNNDIEKVLAEQYLNNFKRLIEHDGGFETLIEREEIIEAHGYLYMQAIKLFKSTSNQHKPDLKDKT